MFGYFYKYPTTLQICFPLFLHDDLDIVPSQGYERPPAWHDITVLEDRLRAYDNRVDVAYITETILQDERGFIVRDPKTNNVSLTILGRNNCNGRI